MDLKSGAVSSALLLSVLIISACDQTNQHTEIPTQISEQKFDQDRKSILAMQGEYRVTFDIRETLGFSPEYELAKPKTSHATEVVMLTNDDGRKITLTHILVFNRGDTKPVVMKHWRQDWSYEPETVLISEGQGSWTLSKLSADERRGAWSQTVWGSGDSPRYGDIGHWRYDGGVARWTAYDTVRPLSRRDAVRDVPFDRYVGMNRHTITPDGWAHEQDNAKVGVNDGVTATYAHEVVLNTYKRTSDISPQPAKQYWAATKDYWASVRDAWEIHVENSGGIVFADLPEGNRGTAVPLLELGEKVAEQALDLAAAVLGAERIIAESTNSPKQISEHGAIQR